MLLALLMATEVATAPVADLHDMYRELEGACWEGQITAEVTDTHCFSVATGGKLAMDVHKVRENGAVTYEGVTLIWRDKPTGKVVYTYLTAFGDVLPGAVVREGNELHFQDDAAGAIRWVISADRYEVILGETHRTFVKTAEPAQGGL